MNEITEQLNKKRAEVLEAIAPIMQAFGIKDYDYIIRDTGQKETLRIHNTKIGCSCNSTEAVINEIIGWLFVNKFARARCLGAFKTQTLNCVKRYWLKEREQ